ncbi:hypothetical protein AMECASPLE_010290 [Ameca splendens]|uniref:Uncharacterized protein n=1 Tax=Ameca splendens TaxID=208324 RepID=A0ABV0Y0L6_9TELE
MQSWKYRPILEETSVKALTGAEVPFLCQENGPKLKSQVQWEWFGSKHIHVLASPIKGHSSPSDLTGLELKKVGKVQYHVPKKTCSCNCSKRWFYKVNAICFFCF